MARPPSHAPAGMWAEGRDDVYTASTTASSDDGGSFGSAPRTEGPLFPASVVQHRDQWKQEVRCGKQCGNNAEGAGSKRLGHIAPLCVYFQSGRPPPPPLSLSFLFLLALVLLVLVVAVLFFVLLVLDTWRTTELVQASRSHCPRLCVFFRSVYSVVDAPLSLYFFLFLFPAAAVSVIPVLGERTGKEPRRGGAVREGGRGWWLKLSEYHGSTLPLPRARLRLRLLVPLAHPLL